MIVRDHRVQASGKLALPTLHHFYAAFATCGSLARSTPLHTACKDAAPADVQPQRMCHIHATLHFRPQASTARLALC